MVAVGGCGGVEAVVVSAVEEVVAVIVMMDDFEYVTLVDGFSAVKAARKFVFIFLMLDILEETFLTGAVPASCHDRFNHGFFATDWTFVAGFCLDLLEDMSTILVRDVLLS